MTTLHLKKNAETELGEIIFSALDQTDISPVQAVRILCKTAGSIALASSENESDFTNAAGMAGTWFKEGAEDLSDLNKAVAGAH